MHMHISLQSKISYYGSSGSHAMKIGYCLKIRINSITVAKLYKAEYQTRKPPQIDLILKFSNLHFLLLIVLHDDNHGTSLYGS